VAACPVVAGRSRFDIADIVRRHRAELEALMHLTLSQRRVLSAIALCRTAALGGHVDVCRSCGYECPIYNSCRNRHCPKCQWLAQERWIRARAERLLPVRHFHVVFTLPSELRVVARNRPRELFNAFFAAVSETLLDLGGSRLDARLGVTMVLHTWTRDLRFHPHLHALVTAGGLARSEQCWVATRTKYLFPVRVMGALLRGKMLAALRELHASGKLAGLDELRDQQYFDRWMTRLARTKWVVYAKKPFRRYDHVLSYLGRYTHRIAISNARFEDVTDATVTFRTKNGRAICLTPVEFLRRFVQHVLPDGFHKIRHYGLYSGAHAQQKLATARKLLPPDPNRSAPAAATTKGSETWTEILRSITPHDVTRCPRCDHPLVHVVVARGPPRKIAA
jgi:Putative transposase/Transposase zinc-binding domain